MKNMRADKTKKGIAVKADGFETEHTHETLICLFELFFKINSFPKYAKEKNIVIPFMSTSGNIELNTDAFSLVFLDRGMSGREVCSYINSRPYSMIGIAEDEAERTVKLEGGFEKRTESVIMINFSSDAKRHHLKSSFNSYAYHLDIFREIQPAYRCAEDNFHINPSYMQSEKAKNADSNSFEEGRELLIRCSGKCRCGSEGLLQSYPVIGKSAVYSAKKRSGEEAFISLLYIEESIRRGVRGILDCSVRNASGNLQVDIEYYGKSPKDKVKEDVDSKIEEIESAYGLEKIRYEEKYVLFK